MKNLNKISVYASSFLSLLTVGEIATSQSQIHSDESSVHFLAAGIADAKRINNIQATVIIETAVPKAFFDEQRALAKMPSSILTQGERNVLLNTLPQSDQKSTKTVKFLYDKMHIYVEGVDDPNSPALLQMQKLIVDHNKAYLLQRYKQKAGRAKTSKQSEAVYSFGFIQAAEDIFDKGTIKNFEILDPRSYAYYEYPGSPSIDELLSSPSNHSTYLGEELVEGSKCAKISISTLNKEDILCWIDVDHNFLLRREQIRTLDGDKSVLAFDTRVPRIQRDSGVWFPAIVERRQYIKPVPVDQGQWPSVNSSDVVSVHVTISDFKANTPISTSKFVMKWPKGTNVRNTMTQTGFVADGNQINEGQTVKPDKTSDKLKADTTKTDAVKTDKTDDVPTPTK